MARPEPDSDPQRAWHDVGRAHASAGARERCFHCAEPLPPGATWRVAIDGTEQPMCCAGCEAVATTIVDAGLSDYYRLRTESAPRGAQIEQVLARAAAYDRPALEDAYARASGDHAKEAHLLLEGIECPACAWLVERTLSRAPGVLEAAVNFSTHRARVRWDPRRTGLGGVLGAVAALGYRAQPYDPARREAALEAERRSRLRRIGVAGLFGMQIMMVAVTLYAGEWWGIAPRFENLFRWLSLALCMPVIGYCAWPFFRGALLGVVHAAPSMDLPVAMGLALAFLASLGATISGHGHVYYDSVAMFTFLLLTARYLEFAARKRAQDRIEALVAPVPEVARRIGSRPGLVPVAELAVGERVRVLPGESVPADAVVVSGVSTVDESLLSGEPRPRRRGVDDAVPGGAVNLHSPLELRVTRVGPEMLISRMLALVERAAASRPRAARQADRLAAGFVVGVVVAAAGVAAWWLLADPSRWLAVTVAVLVVTCPCALSLATPTALTAATGRLAALGLVPARELAVDRLAKVDHVVFDKTGTLTQGRYRLLETVRLRDDTPPARALAVAAALERHSEHPIARALADAADSDAGAAQQVRAEPGRGICGDVGGRRWWLGAPGWVDQHTARPTTHDLKMLARDGASVVLLADGDGAVCAFRLGDELRGGADAVVAGLRARGIGCSLYSGDRNEAVAAVARALGIRDYAGDLLPQDKLSALQALRDRGLRVAMVGDGVNDAPVLAGATVSVAMGGGARAARASADFILLGERLTALLDALDLARRARRTVSWNLAWALTYNLVALPAAAAGLVAPWMAAIGMSASSLLVVANSARLAGGAARR